MEYKTRKKQIGARIRACRKELHLTQQELLDKVFLSSNSVASLRMYEKGERLPDLDTMCRLCDVFGCDLGYLLCDYDEKRRTVCDICQQTGLSEKAVNLIQRLNIENRSTWMMDALNYLLENEHFIMLLAIITENMSGHNSKEIEAFPFRNSVMHSINKESFLKINGQLFLEDLMESSKNIWENREDYRAQYSLLYSLLTDKRITLSEYNACIAKLDMKDFSDFRGTIFYGQHQEGN